MEMLLRDAVVATEIALCLIPKVLDAVDVVAGPDPAPKAPSFIS